MKITARTIAVMIALGAFTFTAKEASAQVNISVKTPSIGISKPKKKDKGEEENKSNTNENQSSSKKDDNGKKQAPEKDVLSSYSNEQITKIMDKSSYPDYNADMKTLEEAKKLYIFYQNANTFYGTLSYDRQEALEQVKQFPKYKEAVNKIGQKYNEYWKVYRAKMNDTEAMENLYLDDKKGVDEFQNTMNQYGNPAADAEKQLDIALSTANELKAKGSMKDDWNNDQYALKVQPALDDAAFFHAVYVSQKGDDATAKSLAQKIVDYKTKCENVKSDIRAMELASVKCPVDAYKGADKEAMKKKVKDYWMKYYPQDKILGIYIIDENWDRQKGTNWNESYNRYEDYDNSWLMVRVVVQKDAQVADIYEASIQKNHMKNNEIDLSYFNKSLGIWKGDMLVKNVK